MGPHELLERHQPPRLSLRRRLPRKLLPRRLLPRSLASISRRPPQRRPLQRRLLQRRPLQRRPPQRRPLQSSKLPLPHANPLRPARDTLLSLKRPKISSSEAEGSPVEQPERPSSQSLCTLLSTTNLFLASTTKRPLRLV